MHQLSREERLLPLKSVSNVRDLGGYETKEGYFTKSHKYIRGASLSKITREDQRILSEYGLKVVIDLRSSYECNRLPDAYVNHPEIKYINVDLFKDPRSLLTPTDMQFKDMGDLYCIMLDKMQDGIRKVFQIFLDHPYDCVLFHCSAGKDRTGVIAALLLDLAGCHREDIVKDYSESYENNLGINADLAKMTDNEKNLLSSPSFMIHCLEHLYENYGSAYAYLQEIGFTQEQVDEIKEMFLF